jgi:hypothetical protein
MHTGPVSVTDHGRYQPSIDSFFDASALGSLPAELATNRWKAAPGAFDVLHAFIAAVCEDRAWWPTGPDIAELPGITICDITPDVAVPGWVADALGGLCSAQVRDFTRSEMGAVRGSVDAHFVDCVLRDGTEGPHNAVALASWMLPVARRSEPPELIQLLVTDTRHVCELWRWSCEDTETPRPLDGRLERFVRYWEHQVAWMGLGGLHEAVVHQQRG